MNNNYNNNMMNPQQRDIVLSPNEYVFVQNFNREPVEIKLPLEKYQVWMGNYDGTIERFGTVILKKSLIRQN